MFHCMLIFKIRMRSSISPVEGYYNEVLLRLFQWGDYLISKSIHCVAMRFLSLARASVTTTCRT